MPGKSRTFPRLLTGAASITAICIALLNSGPVQAQLAAPEKSPAATDPTRQPDDSAVPADIVVTGSRIDRAGFDAPTPMTVISQVELRQGGRTDLQAALGDMPQVRMTQSAVTTNSNTGSGQAPADLRGLGASRTLVLLNGHRFIASDDLQMIPFSLTRDVNVVTGGASAAWGSGAVAGVINVVLDDNITGLSLNAQSGISSRGDGAKQYFNVAYGANLTDRWHIMAGADYMRDRGVQPAMERPRIGATAFVRGTDGILRPTQDVVQADRSTGGLIKNGVLEGYTFNDNGTVRPFQFGRRVGATMVGGEGYSNDFMRSVFSPLERSTVFVRTSYDATDTLKIWAEGHYGRTWNERDYFPDLAPSATPYNFTTDNPYLSAGVRAQLQAAGQSSFNMTRVMSDIAPVRFRFVRQVKEGRIGFDGSIGDNWRYSGFYTHGEQTNDQQLKNLIKNTEFRQAIDVVTGPAGSPVCRIALTDPSTACRPINLFGQNNFDPAALPYATGTWKNYVRTWLDNAGFSINGEPFSVWNRPVSIAAGVEWRKESLQSNYDAISLAGGFATINGVNIPKRGNTVKEAFVEVAAPLLADLPLVQELTFNGAARVSKYSTFGDNIWSWKAGGVWVVDDNIKLRLTRSRDIRAPSLSELFDPPGTLFSAVNDLSKPAGQQSVTAVLRTGGNPNLAPEKADTLTAGAVLTPRFAPGFSLSVDWYKININNVITTLSAQQIINACYLQGVASACTQLIRDASGTLTDVTATYINVAQFRTSGIDAELSYRTQPGSIGLPGQLTVRTLVNHVSKLISDNRVLRVDGAGFAGAQAAFLTPKWRVNSSATYESGNFGGDLRLRWIAASQYAPYQIFGVASANLVDNHIPAFLYADATVRAYIPFGADRRKMTVYFTVANLFDKQPPIAAVSSPYYDIMGRYFTVGATLKF